MKRGRLTMGLTEIQSRRKMWMVGMKCVDSIVNEYETRSTGWERVKISVCILRGLYFTGESSTQLLLVVDIFQ